MGIYDEIDEVMENARRKRPPQAEPKRGSQFNADLACMTGAL